MKTKNLVLFLALFAVMALAFTACGNSGGSSGGDGDGVAVSGVSFNNTSSVGRVRVGETLVLAYTVAPDKADNKSVTWSSDNEGVATVANGVVTGRSPGTARITVTTVDGGKTAMIPITIISATTPLNPTWGDMKVYIYDLFGDEPVWNIANTAKDEGVKTIVWTITGIGVGDAARTPPSGTDLTAFDKLYFYADKDDAIATPLVPSDAIPVTNATFESKSWDYVYIVPKDNTFRGTIEISLAVKNDPTIPAEKFVVTLATDNRPFINRTYTFARDSIIPWAPRPNLTMDINREGTSLTMSYGNGEGSLRMNITSWEILEQLDTTEIPDLTGVPADDLAATLSTALDTIQTAGNVYALKGSIVTSTGRFALERKTIAMTPSALYKSYFRTSAMDSVDPTTIVYLYVKDKIIDTTNGKIKDDDFGLWVLSWFTYNDAGVKNAAKVFPQGFHVMNPDLSALDVAHEGGGHVDNINDPSTDGYFMFFPSYRP